MELNFIKDELKILAVAASGILAGVAVYIPIVEAKSRKNLDTKSKRRQWSDSFDHAAAFVLCTGGVGTLANLALYFIDQSTVRCLWLAEPLIFLCGGVYTAAVMLPEIKELKNDEIVQKKGDQWVEDAINRWGTRHLVRAVLNIAAVGFVAYAAVKSN